jgi:hypothetical protein
MLDFFLIYLFSLYTANSCKRHLPHKVFIVLNPLIFSHFFYVIVGNIILPIYIYMQLYVQVSLATNNIQIMQQRECSKVYLANSGDWKLLNLSFLIKLNF